MQNVLFVNYYPVETRQMECVADTLHNQGIIARFLVTPNVTNTFSTRVPLIRMLPGMPLRPAVDQICEEFHPDLAVVVPRDNVGLDFQHAFEARNIPVLCHLTHCPEFKDPGNMRFCTLSKKTRYAVTSPVGRSFVRGFLKDPQIDIVGCLSFDRLPSFKRKPEPKFTILLIDQVLSTTYRLASQLFKYLKKPGPASAGYQMIIRLHPWDLRSDFDAWLRELQTQRLGHRVRLSLATDDLWTDLCKVDVVVSNSSLAGYEARLVGLPAIYDDVSDSSPLLVEASGPVFRPSDVSKLYEILNKIGGAREHVPFEPVPVPEWLADGQTFAERLCNVITQMLPSKEATPVSTEGEFFGKTADEFNQSLESDANDS